MPLICGSKRLKNQISLIIFNQLYTTISENTLNKRFCLISTWLSKNSISINKLHQKCSQNLFKTLEFSINLKNRSTISLKNAKEDLSTRLSSIFTVESTLLEELSSNIRVSLKKCISSELVSSKSSTMKMTKLIRRSQFFSYLSTPTSVIITFYVT